MTTQALEILSRDAHHVVAIYDDILLQLWLQSVPTSGANAVAEGGKRLAARGKPFKTLIVVGPNAAPPQSPSRAVLLKFGQESAPLLTAAVLVAEPTGLKGAIMRSIMTGMAMVVQSIQVLIVRSVAEGIEGLRAHGLQAGPGELEGVIADLRRAEPSAPPPRSNVSARSSS